MKKLKRDKIVSMTDTGEVVGVYFEGNSKLHLEMPPKEADKLIEIWNKNVKEQDLLIEALNHIDEFASQATEDKQELESLENDYELIFDFIKEQN